MGTKQVNIIGAGLAGCEAAYYLANHGISVIIYENKKNYRNQVQKTSLFAELVCSNSFRSKNIYNAAGLLKNEMQKLNSIVINSALKNQLPAGDALAVDRDGFSNTVTSLIINHPLITIKDEEYNKIDLSIPTLIASGPLTTSALQQEIINYVGDQSFYFYDAVAPIITKESIDFKIAYYKSRYDKGESQDYINCPFTKEQYLSWYDMLINSETISLPDFEKEIFFEGCMPVETMAKRGSKTLLFGPLKPVGLALDLENKPYAVVQLRQDNVSDSLYNIVGFQTNLKWSEQTKIIRMIPGLQNAEIIRYGVMHKNSFINSPIVLNQFLQTKKYSSLFFAGQITGVEGYIESASMGIVAGINILKYINNQPMICFPSETVIGSLVNYITHAASDNFQPMKANFGIINCNQQQFNSREEKKKYLVNESEKMLNLILKKL